MQIKLKETFGNDLLTTMKGNVVRKNEWTEFDSTDKELEHLLDNGFFIVREGGEKEEIVITDVPKKEETGLQKENIVVDVPGKQKQPEHKGLRSDMF